MVSKRREKVAVEDDGTGGNTEPLLPSKLLGMSSSRYVIPAVKFDPDDNGSFDAGRGDGSGTREDG